MPSLKSVYDMTWAEFRIRLFAFKRIELNEYHKLRELMWTCYIAPHLDYKKMSKTKEQFMPLANDKKAGTVNEKTKSLFLREIKKWQDGTR